VVWLDYHGAQIASIVQDKRPIGVDDRVGFALDTAQASLFDEATGMRL
jgi:multiple sugar transport system ATP-binding protein